MAKALVVVESPAKAKTINKYLGRNYKVIASMGHVRDLPKSKLGVDVDDDFEPSYEVIASRKKVLKELKDAAKERDRHLRRDRPGSRRRGDRLASGRGARRREPQEDPPPDVQRDHQEGDPRGDRASRRPSTRRWSTRSRRAACSIGSSATRSARILWDKVRRGLSAGRVQSVALKLICDREARDRRVRPGGVLEHHRAARRRGAAGVRREAAEEATAERSRSATRPKRTRCSPI